MCVGRERGGGQRESETERRKRGKKETEGVGSGESDRASEGGWGGETGEKKGK